MSSAKFNALREIIFPDAHPRRSIRRTLPNRSFQSIMHETEYRKLGGRVIEPIPEGSIKSALRYPLYVLLCQSRFLHG